VTCLAAAIGLVAVIVVAVASRPHLGVARLPSVAPEALTAGTAAPDFDLERLGGGAPVSISGYRGTPVVLNFFASWCPHCRPELPALAALARSAAGRVDVVGVDSNDQDLAAVQALLASADATYPVAVDSKAQVSTQYLLTALPATYFIGANGRIMGAVFGPQTLAVLTTWVHRLLNASPVR
jgi:thiol-disulfide isomerase/thioredoxin